MLLSLIQISYMLLSSIHISYMLLSLALFAYHLASSSYYAFICLLSLHLPLSFLLFLSFSSPFLYLLSLRILPAMAVLLFPPNCWNFFEMQILVLFLVFQTPLFKIKQVPVIWFVNWVLNSLKNAETAKYNVTQNQQHQVFLVFVT